MYSPSFSTIAAWWKGKSLIPNLRKTVFTRKRRKKEMIETSENLFLLNLVNMEDVNEPFILNIFFSDAWFCRVLP